MGRADPMGTRRVRLAGLLIALLLAGVVSFYASGSPDGLERVAQDHGIAAQARDRPDSSPLAGYGTRGISDVRLSGGLAGVTGVLATLALASGLVLVLRRRTGTPADAAASGDIPAVGTGRSPGTADRTADDPTDRDPAEHGPAQHGAAQHGAEPRPEPPR